MRQVEIMNKNSEVRRLIGSYYTQSDPILSYMVSRLEITPNDSILEPCAGEGAFVSKIIDSYPEQDYRIEALDIDGRAVEKLRASFQQENITIRETDTLLDDTLDLYADFNGFYSKIIGNPPYGAWQNYDRRKLLRRRFGGYVRETYSLFIRRAVDLLKPQGKLVYIIPDTFLALHLHRDTREKLLSETTLNEIVLIPSRFFPGVNFGYSNLCIVTLTKAKPSISHSIRIIQIDSKVENLYRIANNRYSVADHYEEVLQDSVLNSVDHSFFIGASREIRDLVNTAEITLGDVAHCVTGFCSGNNKKFYRRRLSEIDILDHSTAILESDIASDYLKRPEILNGLKGTERYIPIVKGGKGRFYSRTEWYVLWDKCTVEFYRTDKKARFQNSRFYFAEGIGVPMVRTSKLKAFLLERRLFDQSVVGVFPMDEKNLYYFLAFLNSDVCTRIINAINHTANNSANYLKKLPIIISDAHFHEVSKMSQLAVTPNCSSNLIADINAIFDEIYQV